MKFLYEPKKYFQLHSTEALMTLYVSCIMHFTFHIIGSQVGFYNDPVPFAVFDIFSHISTQKLV